MWLNSNLKKEFWDKVINESNVNQSIIQLTFTWLWIITWIVFGVWYFISSIWFIVSSVLFWVSTIIWFILIIIINMMYKKINYLMLWILAISFWILEGVWLSWIFSLYTTSSLISAFLGASVLFIIMAIYWYTTKRDITKLWNILLVWLISIIILTLINVFFLHSSMFDIILSIIWIFIFLWLTAWDLQMLKTMSTTWDKRLSIVFWLWLFLDFINIFLDLLRLFGKSD